MLAKILSTTYLWYILYSIINNYQEGYRKDNNNNRNSSLQIAKTNVFPSNDSIS